MNVIDCHRDKKRSSIFVNDLLMIRVCRHEKGMWVRALSMLLSLCCLVTIQRLDRKRLSAHLF